MSSTVGNTEKTSDRVALLWRYLGMPAFLAFACLTLVSYLRNQELDSIERRTLNWGCIVQRVTEHAHITAVTTVFVIAIAVPIGVLLTRPFARRATPLAVGLANLGQAVPSVGLLVLLALVFSTGFKYTVMALVAYAILPVLRNTMVGLQQVDHSIIEAARGMGMSKLGALFRIELPLAVPVILVGIRIALIFNVGTATLATFVNGGGLGDLISNGIALGRQPVLITGSALTAVLALFVDWLAGIVEDILHPKGL
ncbi:ABC transporter permease [soil metagenome]